MSSTLRTHRARAQRPIIALATIVLCLPAAPARADLTGFFALSPSPERHTGFGFAIGGGILIVGWEFEYGYLTEDSDEGVPSLRTFSGNLLVQTPTPGFQLYFTIGGGLYRERLFDRSETSFEGNTGGGAKFSIAGPLRARVDYRIFNLRGSPLHSPVHRFYGGLNLGF
jgi:hypothetical protein